MIGREEDPTDYLCAIYMTAHVVFFKSLPHFGYTINSMFIMHMILLTCKYRL